MPPGTPLGAVNLKDAVTVAGGRLRARYQIRVQSTFALHQTDPTADIAPRDSSLFELFHDFAFR